MIKAAVFDLGGVYFTNGTGIAVERISEKFKLDPESVGQIFRSGSELGTAYRRGEITAKDFWARVKEFLGIDANEKDLSEMWAESYEPMNGTVEVMRWLRNKGVKLYFLSDSIKERVDYLQTKYRFLDDFTDGIFSYRVHKTKLDGTYVFELVLEKTREKPENVVYVDDKEEYAETARKLGMHAVCFKSPEQLRQELERLGL